MVALLFTLLFVATVANGAQFTFKNQCNYGIVPTVTGPGYGPNKICDLSSRNGACTVSYDGQLTFRNGYNGRKALEIGTTKAEFKTNANGIDYYDLSVVDGFDVSMQLINQCNGDTITCPYDQCPEAYDYSTDDSKVHAGSACGSYTIIFCP
ncbi:hypothetical protein M3Y97_00317800 [Aphelenchoides bicaudatus]|nr:hypothetical protein M3Y97_00317800 [Aphelenchoides bicaudatus]